MAIQQTTNAIKVANPSLEDQPRTYLKKDADASSTVIYLSSVSGFPTSGSFYILIGEYGEEKAEIKLVSAVTSDHFTVASTTHAHSASDPVTLIQYNKIRYYGLSAADSTVYNLIETKDIDATTNLTEYLYAGTDYGFFSTAYYNSEDDEISGYSEIVQYSSYTRRSVERIIQSATLRALTTIDENRGSRLTWDIALTILQDGLDEIAARKRRWPFWDTIKDDTTTTNQTAHISKPSDLTQLIGLSVKSQPLTWINRDDYDAYTSGTETTYGEPIYYTEKAGKYYLYPIPNGSYDVVYNYYKVPDVISNMSTEIDIPLVSVLIYYCASQFAYIRGNSKKGDSLYQMYVKLLEDQVDEYSGPGQDSDAEYVERTSAFSEVASLSII